MHGAVEAFVANRLLVRDRDALSGALTLEVAHEALLGEWDRLRGWIDDGRDDLRQHAAYALALDDWLTAGRDPDYLLTGGRLNQFEQWRATTTMRLTVSERDYLDEARRQRDDAEAAEFARGAEQARLRRRARRGAFALGAAVAAIATAAIVALVAATGTSDPLKIAVVSADPLTGSEAGAQYEQGFARAERDFDVVVDRRDLVASADTVIGDLVTRDADLVILDRDAARHDRARRSRSGPAIRAGRLRRRRLRGSPQRHQLPLGERTRRVPRRRRRRDDHRDRHRRVPRRHQIWPRPGGLPGRLRGGRPGRRPRHHDRRRQSGGLRDPPPYDAPEGGRYVADLLYEAGADVIFHVAGGSGDGVLDAASRRLSAIEHWVIGAETDLWRTASTRHRAHVLTSILRAPRRTGLPRDPRPDGRQPRSRARTASPWPTG